MSVVLRQLVYEDAVIAVGLVVVDDSDFMDLAVRWLKPQPIKRKDGTFREMTNKMGGETSWFVLPHSFGASIGRSLVHQHAAGLEGFDPQGFPALVEWLVEYENLEDSMSF